MSKLICLAGFCFLLLACVKDVRKGTKIRLTGRVYDSVKEKYVSGAVVYLLGCDTRFGGLYACGMLLDSGVSDAGGHFSISDNATGRNEGYALTVHRTETVGYDEFLPNEAGVRVDSKDVTVFAQELNHLKLRVQVTDNPYDSLYVRSSQGHERLLVGRSIDTTIVLPVLPAAINRLTYTVKSIGNDSGAIYRRTEDTIRISLADTSAALRKISSTYELPFY